eukprot:gene7749-9082_t
MLLASINNAGRGGLGVLRTMTMVVQQQQVIQINRAAGYSKKNKMPSVEEMDDQRDAENMIKALDEQYSPQAYSGHYVRDYDRKPFVPAYSPKDIGRIKTAKQVLEAAHAQSSTEDDDYLDDEHKDGDGAFELGMGEPEDPTIDDDENSISEHTLVNVGRHVKVTKGGRINSYSTLVFVGNGAGTGGLGYGKGETPAMALQRASRDAERNAITINRYENRTLPSGLDLKFRSTKIRFYKTRDTDMSCSGEKQDVILESLGLQGVDFRTYGRRSWRNIFNVIQKKLPDFINPDELARCTGKKLVTRRLVKEKKENLADLLASKIPHRQTDPYNFGLVDKFLYDLEKPADKDAAEIDILRDAIREYENEMDIYEDDHSMDNHADLEKGRTDPMSKFKRRRFIDSQKVEDSRQLHTQIKH